MYYITKKQLEVSMYSAHRALHKCVTQRFRLELLLVYFTMSAHYLFMLKKQYIKVNNMCIENFICFFQKIACEKVHIRWDPYLKLCLRLTYSLAKYKCYVDGCILSGYPISIDNVIRTTLQQFLQQTVVCSHHNRVSGFAMDLTFEKIDTARSCQPIREPNSQLWHANHQMKMHMFPSQNPGLNLYHTEFQTSKEHID